MIGPELRRLRIRTGLTASAVARKLDWSQSRLSRVETGRFQPSLDEVATLLELYAQVERPDETTLVDVAYAAAMYLAAARALTEALKRLS